VENSCSGTCDANFLANSTREDCRSDISMITGAFSEITLWSEAEVESLELRTVWEAG